MWNFYSSLQWIWFLCFNKFSFDCTSLFINVFGPIEWVCDHVTYDLDSFIKIVFEHSHHIWCVFSRGVGVEVATDTLHSYFQLLSGSILGTFKVKMLQKMCSAAGLRGLVTTATIYEYCDGGDVWLH